MIRDVFIRRHAVGDCDDRATLGVALLLAMGIPAGYIVVTDSDHGSYRHVLPAAWVDGRWKPLDAQEAENPGEFPAGVRRAAVFGL